MRWPRILERTRWSVGGRHSSSVAVEVFHRAQYPLLHPRCLASARRWPPSSWWARELQFQLFFLFKYNVCSMHWFIYYSHFVPGVTDKHQIKGRARLTVMTSTPAIALKDAEVASTSTLSNPPSTRTSESPVKESSLLNPIYLSRLRLPPFSRSRTHVSQTNSKSPTPPERAFSSRSQSLNAYVPQGSLIAISQSVSLAIYDSLHRLTRVVFYCMLAIGIAMLTIGLMIYLFLRQRRARLAADEAEAQRRLKYTISVVWTIFTPALSLSTTPCCTGVILHILRPLFRLPIGTCT